jgi:hypothetical protein
MSKTLGGWGGGGKGCHASGITFTTLTAYRSAGPAYRSAGPAYRSAGPAYRSAGPPSRSAGPPSRSAGPPSRSASTSASLLPYDHLVAWKKMD